MSTLISERRSYVAGRWVEGDEVLAVENPADESHLTDVSVTPLAEFRHAIADGRRAFDEGPWSSMPPEERANVLQAFIDHVEANGASLVATMVAEAGSPLASPSRRSC